MKQKDIIAGLTYTAMVSGKLQPLNVKSIQQIFNGKREVTRYRCVNLNTGREVIVKSAAKFRTRVVSGTVQQWQALLNPSAGGC